MTERAACPKCGLLLEAGRTACARCLLPVEVAVESSRDEGPHRSMSRAIATMSREPPTKMLRVLPGATFGVEVKAGFWSRYGAYLGKRAAAIVVATVFAAPVAVVLLLVWSIVVATRRNDLVRVEGAAVKIFHDERWTHVPIADVVAVTIAPSPRGSVVSLVLRGGSHVALFATDILPPTAQRWLATRLEQAMGKG